MAPQIIDAPPITYDIETGHEDKRADPDRISMAMDEKKEDPTPAYKQDAFGDEEFAEVKYKVLKWWQCGLLMVAETVSLGVLSLPQAVSVIGLVPAIILLIGLGILATYTGYVIGQFKWKHPHISNMADAGEVLMGKFGRELLGIAQMLFLVFIMASHILTFTVAMNTITNHAFASIFAAVMITMIAVGVQDNGGAVEATVKTNLFHGFTAVTNIVFAFAGHAAFFGLMAELKNPREFPKALCLLQTIDISLYVVAAIVIYRYTGAGVASPALGSAGPLVSKIAYGIALPTIIIAGVINGHIAFKYVYIRIFRGTDRMHKRDLVAVGSWIAIGLFLWILAWIIASAIPVFSSLLSLITALFASWFTYGLSGIFWLHMNKGLYFSSPRKIALTILNLIIVGIGGCLCGLGLYVSGKAIHDNPSSASFSCAASN